MNDTAYLFHIGPLHFIINAQYSNTGMCYPRVFVRFPDNSYLNYDLSLCACFKMTEDDWCSWLDGTETILTDIKEVHKVANHCGIKWQNFENMVFTEYQNAVN